MKQMGQKRLAGAFHQGKLQFLEVPCPPVFLPLQQQPSIPSFPQPFESFSPTSPGPRDSLWSQGPGQGNFLDPLTHQTAG